MYGHADFDLPSIFRKEKTPAKTHVTREKPKERQQLGKQQEEGAVM